MNPWQPPSRTLGQPHQAEGDLLRNLPVPLLPQTITDTPTGLSRGQPQGPSLYSPFSSTGSPNYALVKTPLSSPTSEDTLPPHATYKEKEHVQRKRHWDTVMLEPTDDPLDHSPIFSAGSSTGIPSVHDGLPQRSHSFFGEERILRPFGIIPEQAPRMESLLETMLTASSKPVLEETPPLTPSNSGSLSQAEELMVEQIAAASSTPRLGVSSKQKRFQCHLCGSTFAQRGDMIRHIRVKELGERNFSCQVCSKTFGRRSILNKHLDRVHGVRAGKAKHTASSAGQATEPEDPDFRGKTNEPRFILPFPQN